MKFTWGSLGERKSTITVSWKGGTGERGRGNGGRGKGGKGNGGREKGEWGM